MEFCGGRCPADLLTCLPPAAPKRNISHDRDQKRKWENEPEGCNAQAVMRIRHGLARTIGSRFSHSAGLGPRKEAVKAWTEKQRIAWERLRAASGVGPWSSEITIPHVDPAHPGRRSLRSLCLGLGGAHHSAYCVLCLFFDGRRIGTIQPCAQRPDLFGELAAEIGVGIGAVLDEQFHELIERGRVLGVGSSKAP